MHELFADPLSSWEKKCIHRFILSLDGLEFKTEMSLFHSLFQPHQPDPRRRAGCVCGLNHWPRRRTNQHEQVLEVPPEKEPSIRLAGIAELCRPRVGGLLIPKV